MPISKAKRATSQGSPAATPLIIAGTLRNSEATAEVHSPYDNHVIAAVCQATGGDADEALRAAEKSFPETKALSSWQRSEILQHIATRIEREALDLARGIALEAGKPLSASRTEVQRAIQTFRVAAEEARRIGGELLPLDWTPGNEQRAGLTRRFPIGPILGITPFNFPLNLVAHKLAPA